MRRPYGLGLAMAFALSVPAPGWAGFWSEKQSHAVQPEPTYQTISAGGPAIYSFPINIYPDGWAALKAEPWGESQRLTKVYEGTLFLVVGAVPGWKLVQFKSGERGWIAERLVGCCRPASH